MASTLNSFGFSLEDSNLKMAHIIANKEELKIVDLQTIRYKEEDSHLAPSLSLEEALEGLDFDFGTDDPFFSSTTIDKTPQEESEIPITPTHDPFPMGLDSKKDMEDLAREKRIENGTISMNLDYNNIVYKEMDLPARISKRALYSRIKKQFYEDEVPSVMTITHMKRNDGSYVGVTHEKNMELLERFIMINRAISKKRFHYSYIQTNEFALINALRFNYSVRPDDISAIIYIGKDNTQVFLTRGYEFLVDLPVITESYQSRDIINTVISRIMLERSHLGIQAVNNYFLAGEGLQNTMIDFLKNRDPDALVEFLIPKRICELTDYSDKYDDKTLASYIIPIMLAVVAALPKEQFLIRSNFLPKQLKEQQNHFSIGAESFLVLGIVLIVGLISINSTFNKQTANSRILLDNTTMNTQLQVEQTRLDSIFSLERQIDQIEKNISRTNQLIGHKNQWHHIIEKISETFMESPLSWLTSMKNQNDTFIVTGYTNNRLNIIELSNLFPEAVVKHITESKIQNSVVWTFEIVFSQPDPIETKRLDYQRESDSIN